MWLRGLLIAYVVARRPLQGIANARPETKAASQPCVAPSKLPFDPREFIKKLPGWEGTQLDQAE